MALLPRTQALQEKEEKGPGTYCTGDPRKNLQLLDTIVYTPFIVHRNARHIKPANDHYGITMRPVAIYEDSSACACNRYQTLSPPLEWPG
jgi:hypothetical protein